MLSNNYHSVSLLSTLSKVLTSKFKWEPVWIQKISLVLYFMMDQVTTTLDNGDYLRIFASSRWPLKYFIANISSVTILAALMRTKPWLSGRWDGSKMMSLVSSGNDNTNPKLVLCGSRLGTDVTSVSFNLVCQSYMLIQILVHLHTSSLTHRV